MSIKLFFGKFGGFNLNRDFTVRKYSELLDAFKDAGYEFQTFRDFLKQPLDRVVILRHDVDRLPKNALKLASLEYKKEISATYYFRIKNHIFEPNIIEKIYNLDHEIGYHYEDVDLANGNIDKAFILFKKNLDCFRSITPIYTICMHGSPMSKYDNRALWEKYDYRSLGIIGEPYFDIDYSNVFYLTDTGRKWNRNDVNIRDKVDTPFSWSFEGIDEIIISIKKRKLPDQIMLNTHPHRWFDEFLPWFFELIFQGFKNTIKKIYSTK